MNNLKLYFAFFLFAALLSGCATTGKVSRSLSKGCIVDNFKICFVYVEWRKNTCIIFAKKGDSLYKIYSIWNPKHNCRGKSVELIVGETYRLYLCQLYDESECKNRDIAEMFNLHWLEENHISLDCCVRNVFIATNICNDYIMKKPCRFLYRKWRHFAEPDLGKTLPLPESFRKVIQI